MEAINKAERTTSLVNFTVVYILIIAIPVIMAFFAGTRRNSGGGSAKAVSEQELLLKQMEALQQNIVDMKALDTKRPGPNSSSENWKQWLDEADAQNETFKQAVNSFRSSRNFTGARDKMRQSGCTYLDAVYYERGVHLENLKTLRGVKNESAVIQQLQADNQRLQSEKNNLQNTVNMQNAMMAQQANTSGGGGAGSAAPTTQALTDLKWQLRFEDADCKKSQADMLATYNDANRRRQLYSSAKANFQQIAQLARSSYTLQRQASVKVREIDQTMSRL